MRLSAILALSLVLMSAAACRESAHETATNEAVAAPAALTPEELGRLGADIRNDPERADELISQRGLTRDSFEQAIRDVTEDTDASRRYAAAYRQANS